MIRLYFILGFLLITTYSLYAQQVAKGIIYDNAGNPAPFATIRYSDGRVFVTDVDGKYEIPYCEKCTVNLDYDGTTKVIRLNSYEQKQTIVAPILSVAFDSLRMSIQDSTYKFNYFYKKTDNNGFYKASNFSNLFIEDKDSTHIIIQNKDDLPLLRLNYHTEHKVSSPFRLYSYQKKYAQGRSQNGMLIYNAPETNELLSFGPEISQLSYGLASSPYYPQGNIVNEIPTRNNSIEFYDENDIFSPIYAQLHHITFGYSVPKKWETNHYLSYLKTDNLLPANPNISWNIRSQFKVLEGFSDKMKFDVSYRFSTTYLPFETAILSKILYANAITPIHFNSKLSTLLPDGMPRNFSKLAYNPYYLLEFSPDKTTNQEASISVYRKESQNFLHQLSIVCHYNQLSAGLLPYPNNINPFAEKRNEKLYWLKYNNHFNLELNNDILSKLEGTFSTEYIDRNLSRKFYSNSSLAEYSNYSTLFKAIKTQKESLQSILNLSGKTLYLDYFIDIYPIQLSTYFNLSTSYHSLAKNPIQFSYFIRQEFNNIFRLIDLEFTHNTNYYVPSFYNNNLNFNLLQYNVADFNSYYPYQEIQMLFPLENIRYFKNTITLKSYFRIEDFRLSPSLQLYTEKTKNQHTTVFQNNVYEYVPMIDYTQKGIDASLVTQYYFRNSNQVNYLNLDVNFSTYNNKVTHIRNGNYSLPFAGFADVYKAYVINQPIGVILGNTFLRNSHQELILDNDGFPIKDENLRVIANPNPDFILNWNLTFKWQKFKLIGKFDWHKGGTMWNGTLHTLNYFGKSQLSEHERNITNYIFSGVAQNGSVNTQAVAFYNPNLSVEENKWQRYGLAGVAEESVVDASFFRLSYVAIAYEDTLGKHSKYRIELFSENLFIYSKNKTAFINNAMLYSTENVGLDFFNAPTLQSIGLSLNFNF